MQPDIDFKQTAQLQLTLGHVLTAWHTLSTHFGNLRDYPDLSEAQRRAVWGLEDALGRCLAENGLGVYGSEEEKTLLEAAAKHMESVYIECLG